MPVTFAAMLLACCILVGASLPRELALCRSTEHPISLELARDGECASCPAQESEGTAAAAPDDSPCGDCIDIVLVPVPDGRRRASIRGQSRFDSSASHSAPVSVSPLLGDAAPDRSRSAACPAARSAAVLLSSIVLIV